MRKLATFAFSFAAALLLAVYLLPAEYVLYIAVGFAVVSTAGFVFKNDFGKRLTIIFISAALALTWFSGYNALFRRSAEQYDGASMRISAEITDFPEAYDYGTRVQANVVIDSKSFRSLLYFYHSSPELVPGDVISADASIKMADSFYGEDTLYYAANGCVLKLSVTGDFNILHSDKLPVRYYPAAMSKLFEIQLDKLFADFESSFMKALLLGKDHHVPDDFGLKMQRTGLTHVFVVSGLHIGFIVSLISLLARRRRLTAAIAIPVIIFFSAMNGFSPSVCRAAVMYILVMSAPLFYRDSDGLTNISLALLVLLVVNPNSISSVALQLSFACSIGMSIFSRPIYNWLKNTRPVALLYDTKFGKSKPGHYILNFARASICSSFGVLVTTVPILAMYYGSICIISPLSNLLTLWAFSLCFTVGMLCLPISFISAGIGSVIALIPRVFIKYIQFVVTHLADIPFATVSAGFFGFKLWILFVYAVIVFSVICKNKRPFVQMICCVVTFAAVFVANRMYVTGSKLTFTALDVGQGQCLAVNSSGETVVIDCGGTEVPLNALSSHLTQSGTDVIDMLIVTHFHDDHAEYIPAVIDSFDVDTVVIPDVPDETGLRYRIIQTAERNGCELIILSNDAFVDFGTASIEIFGPLGGETANEQCLSMVISQENYDILVTADMDITLENLLVAVRDLPDVEVLVAGHHGSKHSTGEKLLETVRPETAVISVGYNNYGHPADETLYRLESMDVEVLRTDECGNITIRK